MWKVWAICALQIWPLCAAADGFSLKQGVQVGRPIRAADITLGEGDSLTVELLGTRLAIPAHGVRSASVESVHVASDANVTIVRASADNGEWIALLGGVSGKELLIAERSDLHGDPGERRALALSVDKTPTGELATVSLGTRFDGLTPCGSAPDALPNRRVLDPKTLKLVARPSLPTAAAALAHATVAAQTQASQAKLQLLSATSSTVIDPLTNTPQIPRALVDGQPATSWSMPAASLTLLRWSQRALPIERFEIEFVGRKAPALLTFYLEGGAFDVSLAKPGAGPDRFSITPPAATESGCIALAGDAKGTLQVAELVALTRVDTEAGLERLVSDLVQDGPAAPLAAELLASLGEPAARAVATRFSELSPRGQRRALKTLGSALALDEVQTRVLEAARSKDDSLQQAALALLAHGKDAGARGLRTLALEPSASGDAAARVLAGPDREELSALVAALLAPGGADRPVLRRALISVALRTPAAFDAAAQTVTGANSGAGARVALALVAAAAERPEIGRTLAESALEVTDFPSRFRLCLAASQLAPSAKLDAWLAQKAVSSEEWMLRRAAYEALLARGSAEAAGLADKLAADKYPRVRAAAAPALARSNKGAPLIALAYHDPWPLVRVAAVQSLARLPNSRRALEASLEDGSRNVRAASIDGLAAQKANELWPSVEKRLLKEDEWPVVKAAAIHFAAALCVQPARAALTEAARRALHPEASDDDRSLGLDALRALHDLGGEAAADARLIATRDTAPPQLKRIMEQAGPPRCEAKTAAVAR
jgi:HEAT repeat protein